MSGTSESSAIVSENGSEKQRCTNCKCWRYPHDFIGAKGQPVKRCTKCREKDKKSKESPQVREKRNARDREKQYYKQYREKKRSANEEAYLAHNAAMAKKWRQVNKDHLAEWQRHNLRCRVGSIKQQAGVKGIPWNDEMTQEVCDDMVKSPCFYCNSPVQERLHGIDRMDNTKGYCLENCVPCCKECNFMKKALDAHTFIQRCLHISSVHGGEGKLYPDSWTDSKSASIYNYKERAEKKSLEFELTKEEFDTLKDNACAYCSRANTATHKNGIDRMDNSKGYTMDNCVTCCGQCNQMKTNMGYNEYIGQCQRVATYIACTIINIPDMERCGYAICKRQHATTNKE